MDDRGSATVVGAFVTAALVVATAAVVSVGAAVSARHQAQSAADLAALAGAAALTSGSEAGCAAATASADRMDAVLDGCAVEEWDVQVRVRVRIALLRFGERDAVASARAGPVKE
ncbi:flp pilus-assembly TadE/G-like family protein [Rhodococcus sp. BP-349]|uniref:Rv3654c family TadE-like protein n=1 Tax=unclassified Rhodococcus (in: high G+C Gram-positive bacteria) TaxID=192944 RepID=UPI001C9B8082|nr:MULTISPECIES: Rv3654c family TadE-like protein [unclassified Rhodococcus (in: high G+C Gram-positive bacteria)]MBY6537259.1 flp pilus-assembly TadE/G-like family protein [Rhodococcus sp. BP-363]MBY6541596.1 flp pilus-assembly TadE/G-like family protein [Rhodococcus sp. BP-369]MBY6560826.1 flp pilus-assembly TadE/G-like family protein [Rhodococcus sp. BP-370]MBY6575118.1 flp pilus-assembly TadE/G-like family protein [Rhodococcus sp. BP-364]MBY6584419.1 flp pilus-assembly TadE/G-like family p